MRESMGSTTPPRSQAGLQSRSGLHAATVAVIAGTLASLACTTAPPKPTSLREHFTTGKDAWYPQDRYVTGAGQGSDAGSARAAAFADIGAQIQAKIESTLVVHEQAMTGPGGSTTLSKVTSNVRQHTTFDRPGLAKVVDTQMVEGTVHVFAALERAALAGPFLRDVERTRVLLRRAQEDFATAETKMDLRAAGRLAKEVGQQAQDLASALVMVESTSAGLPLEGEWADVAKAAQIESQLRRMRAKAKVEICLTPTPDFPEGSQLVSALVDQAIALGVAAVPCGQAEGNATFRAEGRIAAVFSREAALGDAVFCRPSVDLRLLDVKSGAEMLSAALGGDAVRAAGRDREVATRAALKKLAAVCVPKLAEALGAEP
jgi:hypothetical protein